MAKRLIDAKALKKLAYPNGYSDVIGESRMVVDVTDIDNAPTVEAVVPVRCGECFRRNTAWCPLGDWTLPHDDDFCSYGEKESEGSK